MDLTQINESAPAATVHPSGEGVFDFPTSGGQLRLAFTGETLTPFCGLVPWTAFTRHLCLFENFANTSPLTRKSPKAAPTYDVLQSFALT